MTEKRDSFIFYRSFYEAICELDDVDKLKAYEAITEYAMDGTEPEGSGISMAIFKLVKPQIDANKKRYENGCKGGAPKRKKSVPDPDEITKPEPKKAVQEPTKEPDVKAIKHTTKGVQNNPSIEEVKQYFVQAGEAEDQAEHFFNHYDALGWRNVNGVKIQRWDSKANEWIFNNKKDAKNRSKNGTAGVKSGYNPNSGGCGLKRRPDSGV